MKKTLLALLAICVGMLWISSCSPDGEEDLSKNSERISKKTERILEIPPPPPPPPSHDEQYLNRKLETPPPPPPPPPSHDEQYLKYTESMPRFPGCESLSTENAKNQCAQKKLLQYMYENIKYPTEAKKNNIEGRIIARFVVFEDGSIQRAKILKGLGGECDEEALRVINSMNSMSERWTPGKKDGKAVKVEFTLPIVFKLRD